MKPIEILGMIEEAAGTRMYEMKKTAAVRTIMRKQHKLDEIDAILREEIQPQLKRLRDEKTHFISW
jgi:structural maintenance of chromosome 2